MNPTAPRARFLFGRVWPVTKGRGGPSILPAAQADTPRLRSLFGLGALVPAAEKP
jgi:hypothetical protein